MRKILTGLVLVIAMSMQFPVVFAAKYPPINEIPDQVPSSEKEREIWDIGIAHQQQVRDNGEVINDPALEKYLEGIVAKLMGDLVQQIGMDVDVLVFRDQFVNAWVYPNGTIAVQTGLLAAMDNEAQLAAILGHEVSHFLNRHAYIQIRSKQKQSAIGKGLGALAAVAVAAKTGAVNTDLIGAGQIWTDLVTSGYSRKLETRADKQGLQLLVNAGYPAEEALPAFEQLRIKEDDQINFAKVWSSHPDIDSRLKNLKKQIKKLETYEAAPVDSNQYVKRVGSAVLINAGLFQANRQFDDARANIEKYLAADSSEPYAHFLLGETYRNQYPESHFDERIAAYDAALTARSGYEKALKEKGMALRQQGKNELAVQAFKSFLRESPNALDAPIVEWYIDSLRASANSGGGQ